ncbi:MAG TPA: hypothetical protein VFP35_02095 [Candidatus Saccharimonadales bacterium]|nr:hypothetical protein [Candidatus Saccharimonadales bacterium]
MGPAVVSFLFAIGSGSWIYTKFQRRGGASNTRQSVQAAGICALLIFIIVFFVLKSWIK